MFDIAAMVENMFDTDPASKLDRFNSGEVDSQPFENPVPFREGYEGNLNPMQSQGFQRNDKLAGLGQMMMSQGQQQPMYEPQIGAPSQEIQPMMQHQFGQPVGGQQEMMGGLSIEEALARARQFYGQ